jgi:anaerobic dimethyl sulfoxide reductase subunit C
LKTKEWPLIIFTLLSQTAAGMLLTWSVFELIGVIPFMISPEEPLWLIPGTITLLLAAAGVTAGLHLRRPNRAFLAASNWQQSWLSREMVFALLFGAASAALTLLQSVSLPLVLLRLGLRALALLAATLLLWSMVRLYRLRTVPAWTALAASVSFTNAALLLGPATLAVILNSGIFVENLPLQIQELLSIWISVLVILQLLASLLLPFRLRYGTRAARKSALVITGCNRPAYIMRLLSAAAVLALLISSTHPDTPAFITILCLLWLGEVIGRWLFYASYQRVGI